MENVSSMESLIRSFTGRYFCNLFKFSSIFFSVLGEFLYTSGMTSRKN